MKIEIERPVVPKWFDDWYKSFEGDNNKALYHLARVGWGHVLTDSQGAEVEGYYNKVTGLPYMYAGQLYPKEYLTEAILHGYEVEQEPLYYAKIKGCDILDIYFYWVFYPYGKYLTVGEEHEYGGATDMMTKEEWNKLGVNDTNADFERVEDKYEN